MRFLFSKLWCAVAPAYFVRRPSTCTYRCAASAVADGGRRSIMTRKTKKWLLGTGVFLGIGGVALTIAGYVLVRRIDPYIRQQAIRYLHERFDSDVELTSLSIQLPSISSLKLLFTGGRGALARIQGEGLSLRHKGRRDVPPMFAMSGWKRWAFKPVDPFFSKDGVGTFLRIKIEGSAKEPKFGLDLGKKASTTTRPASDQSAKYEFSN